MTAPLRALLIFLGSTLLIFAGFWGWFIWNFQDRSIQPQYRLQPLIPDISRAVANDDASQLYLLLKPLPFRVVIADPDGRILATNLPATSPAARLRAAQEALRAQDFNASLRTPDGLALIYYTEVSDFWHPVLWFPLVFSLLLGLCFSLWDYLRCRELEQVEEIHILARECSPVTGDEPEHDAEEWARLQGKITLLQKQLEFSEKRLTETRLTLHRLQEKQAQTSTAEQGSDQERLQQEKLQFQLKQLQEQLSTQEELEQYWRDKQDAWLRERQELRQQQTLQEQELQRLNRLTGQLETERNRLQQLDQEQKRQLSELQTRLLEWEDINRQCYEAYQEIEKLRKSEWELLHREELWQREKQKLIAILGEREQLLKETRTRLSQSRQKLREISIAYKQALELGVNMPDDLIAARRLLEHLIADKDSIERENAQLQVELGDKQSEIHRLRKELETRAQHLQEADHRIEELEKELKKLRLELELLGETLSDKLLDLDRLSHAHSEDTLAMEGLMQERDVLKVQLQELEDRLQQQEEARALLLFEKEALAEKLEAIDVQDYELQIEQLRQSVQVMGVQLQRKQQAIETLKQKLQQGADLYEKIKHQVEARDRQIRHLKAEMERKDSIIRLLEQKLDHFSVD